MTIIEAIKEVMRKNGAPMTAKEAYDAIISDRLYDFHAQDPAGVVITQIRRHSESIDIPSGAPTKHFKLVGENKFFPLEEPKRLPRSQRVRKRSATTERVRSLSASPKEIQVLREQYVAQLKSV